MRDLGFAALLIFFSSAIAQACTCFSPGPPCQAVWKADAVFSAQAISIEAGTSSDKLRPMMRVVHLALKETFRGVVNADIEINTGWSGGDCGYEFRVGEQYLVYAYRGTDQKFWTSICSRTRLLGDAKEDLSYLRDLSRASTNATLMVFVEQNPFADSEDLKRSPLEGAKVIVDDGSKKIEARTDEAGKLELTGLTSAGYTVRLEVEKGLAARPPEQKVEVATKGCASLYFAVIPDGRLSGKVFNASGEPVEKAEVVLLELGKEKWARMYSFSEKDGSYSFARLHPGRYVLAIRFDGVASSQRPFPRIYYPGFADPELATVINLNHGQWVESFDLHLPDLPKEWPIEGRVIWSDGRPVTNARVQYKSGDATLYSVEPDPTGYFFFKLYEGLKISIYATVVDARGKSVQSKSIEIQSRATKLELTIPTN